MVRKWIKRIGVILLTPIFLFVLIMILLYIPPIQNLLRKEATAYASKATGMQIQVQRIDLRFPLKLLVRGVEVVQAPDTLLTLESLSASVQALPLFKGKVELDHVTLRQASVNTAGLIKSMQIKGVLGSLSLQSHGIDLSDETALINLVEISDTHLQLCLNDTAEAPKDTTSTQVNWQILLQQAKLNQVSFSMQMPGDSLRLATHVGEAGIENVEVNLRDQHYGLEKLLIVGSSVKYDTGASAPAKGFDPSHIALRDVRIAIDSVWSRGKEMNAVIREFSMNERSGLSIASLTGSFSSDSQQIRVPGMKLTTPHSEINVAVNAFWDMLSLEEDRLNVRLDVRIGKQDVLLIAGNLPETFKKEYPFRPFVVQLTARGNMNKIEIPRLSADLPGAFSISGGGEMLNVLDSVNRSGSVALQMTTHKLGFLTALTGMPDDGTIVIPEGIVLAAKAGMRGPQYTTTLLAREGHGVMHLDANLNADTQVYNATVKVDSLQINHFLPKDSIRTVAVVANLKGQGFDFTSHRTQATVAAAINQLGYGRYKVSGVHLAGELKNSRVSADLKSNNSLLVMDAVGEYVLNKPYIEAKATVHVSKLNLQGLGLIPDTLKHPVAFELDAMARQDSLQVSLNSGDLKFSLRSRSPLEALIKESLAFTDILKKQVEAKRLDHAELRRSLPSAGLMITAGRNNPVSEYLALQKISYNNLRVGFVATPRIGINGRAFVHALKMDTLQLDTVYFSIKQDTALMALQGGVTNGPRNPQYVFKASVEGEIRTEDAELTLNYLNGKGETGLLLGVNIRPGEKGIQFKLTPEKPIIANREFSFNGHNSVYLRNDYRVSADVEMMDKDGTGLRVRSIEEDTVSLQNLDIEIRRIELAGISEILPYLPNFSGLFSLEANYKQSRDDMLVSAEATINDLNYEESRIGNMGVGVAWLPDGQGMHHLDVYLTNEGTQIMSANGTYQTTKNVFEINSTLEHFPLHIANTFIPDEMVELSGDMDGDLALTGSISKPLLNGKLILDDAVLTSRQYGVNFRLDDRPVQILNSRLTFDKFAIYSTNKNNPFTIDGTVDFSDLSGATANLSLLANNYPLLNAPRTDNSMLYGKINLDLKSTVRGPLSSLVMRGNVNLLGTTDVTYVLMDSPLSVQDRLGDLVEFTSFSDTLSAKKKDTQLVTLGGLDMLMTINIDQAARVKVDLSPDRSSRVELEGGGNLSFQYNPQGDMTLTGRYTLSGGTIRYSLPVIPLKEFKVKDGSYVEWSGNPMDPLLNLKATERMRSSVSDNDVGSRMVNFDVSIEVKNKLKDLEVAFNLEAPDDAAVRKTLDAMAPEERNKQAIAMMATGMFLAAGGESGGGFEMGAALNKVLQSQISNVAGSALKSVNISFGMENYDDSGGKHTNYNFSYSQRLFNDRVQVVIGGRVSTGQEANQSESFIDNVSLEYRLDQTGTRYVHLFYDKNYESILEGEITEAGVGIILRKKVNHLGELFIFKKAKK